MNDLQIIKSFAFILPIFFGLTLYVVTVWQLKSSNEILEKKHYNDAIKLALGVIISSAFFALAHAGLFFYNIPSVEKFHVIFEMIIVALLTILWSVKVITIHGFDLPVEEISKIVLKIRKYYILIELKKDPSKRILLEVLYTDFNKMITYPNEDISEFIIDLMGETKTIGSRKIVKFIKSFTSTREQLVAYLMKEGNSKKLEFFAGIDSDEAIPIEELSECPFADLYVKLK